MNGQWKKRVVSMASSHHCQKIRKSVNMICGDINYIIGKESAKSASKCKRGNGQITIK